MGETKRGWWSLCGFQKSLFQNANLHRIAPNEKEDEASFERKALVTEKLRTTPKKLLISSPIALSKKLLSLFKTNLINSLQQLRNRTTFSR